MARDITREDLRYLIRQGLSTTRGSYRLLVELFNMQPQDYKRFLNFLRKHDAHVAVHEFRSAKLHQRPVATERVAAVGAGVSDIP
jgi:hypothetical protein